jgi:hypothetical protein
MGIEIYRFLIAIKLIANILIGGVEMLNKDVTQASDTGTYIDTAGFLNDVELAEMLLENGKQNGAQLSY